MYDAFSVIRCPATLPRYIFLLHFFPIFFPCERLSLCTLFVKRNKVILWYSQVFCFNIPEHDIQTHISSFRRLSTITAAFFLPILRSESRISRKRTSHWSYSKARSQCGFYQIGFCGLCFAVPKCACLIWFYHGPTGSSGG